MTAPTPIQHLPPRTKVGAGRIALSLIAVLGVLAALLFIPAGRLDWVEAWALLAAYGVFLALYAAWGLLKDPDQLRERSQARRAENVKPWDKAIMAMYTVLLLLTPVVAGLDAGRCRWSAVPLAAKLLAWLGLALAGALIFWAITTNTYLSRMARIQDDRGQVAITAGPYRFMRHPMYLGIILLFLGMPVALGSWWALLPGTAIGLLFVLRTAQEDRMLRDELPGYAEYAQRVRYRLVPRVW
ncbi:MAG: isoprenylcysteine carboxylmethyltransferase family protein [Chloroflexi bacterium]|nr:isoprenylcysteine carboxylmethyltransferase family protein [Chloroflexota bacterium]